MKTLNISEIPNLLKGIGLMDNGNNTLDVDQNEYWTRETEAKYNSITNKMDKLELKGKGYKIYVWYDVSGYDYWVLKQRDLNYAQITISFDNDAINKSQLPALKNKINKMIDKVNLILEA